MESLAGRALGLALLFAGALSTGAQAAAPAPRQPAGVDTGFEVEHQIFVRSVYWMDDERLLLAGSKSGEPRRDRRRLYVWNAGTRSGSLYEEAATVCFSEGFVRTVAQGDPMPNPLTCREHSREALVPRPGPERSIAVLRGKDGYLDLGPALGATSHAAQPRNLVLHTGAGKAIELPMTWEEQFLPTSVSYSEFRRAYVLRPSAPRGAELGRSDPWPSDQPLVAYLLFPDGRTESVQIPRSPAEYLVDPAPSIAGWLFGGGNSPRTMGLYVFSAGRRPRSMRASFRKSPSPRTAARRPSPSSRGAAKAMRGRSSGCSTSALSDSSGAAPLGARERGRAPRRP